MASPGPPAPGHHTVVVESLPSRFQEIIRSTHDMKAKKAVPITASAMIAANERAVLLSQKLPA